MAETDQKGPVHIGDVVAGKYRIEHVLGAGGMGVVYAALHIHLEQKVALKFVLPQVLAHELSKERFLREARAAVRLKSEHVARVLDVGTLETGEPFQVMELLEGCDLSALMKQQRPVRIADAAEYVLQACEAIIEAHSLGIVHRDLKPQNLFITRRTNGAPLVKVLDFGISKSTGPGAAGAVSLTQSSTVLGSPLYMAPEQMRSARNVDVRGDVWSLGVILYELLTGRVPFDGESMTELCLKVVNDPPPAPKDLRADIPDALVKIVARCLEKDPANRFPNVAMLAMALEPFSASAERGTTDRTWRSLVDTADQMDIPSVLRQPSTTDSSPLPVGGTLATFGGTKDGKPAPKTPKRTFTGGLLAGVATAAALGGVAFFTMSRPPAAPPAPLAAHAAAEHVEASSVIPEVIPTASATAPWTATPPPIASAPTTPRKPSTPSLSKGDSKAKPASSAAARAPSAASTPSAPSSVPAAAPPSIERPNGAPILH
jgi:eukaryotic-like serine/threonine-protein kinase